MKNSQKWKKNQEGNMSTPPHYVEYLFLGSIACYPRPWISSRFLQFSRWNQCDRKDMIHVSLAAKKQKELCKTHKQIRQARIVTCLSPFRNQWNWCCNALHMLWKKMMRTISHFLLQQINTNKSTAAYRYHINDLDDRFMHKGRKFEKHIRIL